MLKIGSEEFVIMKYMQHKTGVNSRVYILFSLLNALHAIQI